MSRSGAVSMSGPISTIGFAVRLTLGLAVGLTVGLAGLGCASSSRDSAPLAPPWEAWRSPVELTRVRASEPAGMRSSYCLSGCRYDRHSSGDSRFLRVEGDEGVLFEDRGAGAITRIWMTTGAGVSAPLDPDVRIRIYLDDAVEPTVDTALPSLFDGTLPPFLPPLVGNRSTSSGGYFSYVTIPYRTHCRIALVGAQDARLWFQIGYRRASSRRGIRTFDGGEDFAPLSSLLSSPGADPWISFGGRERQRTLELPPGESAVAYAARGEGVITGLWLDAPSSRWGHLRISLRFDGRRTVDLPVRDFFAVGGGSQLPIRSLLIGLNADGRLYSYFPAPYFREVEARISNTGPAESGAVTVTMTTRLSDSRPLPDSGLFGAQLNSTERSVPVGDLPLLEVDGEGQWVGLVAELGSIRNGRRAYLEGDERIYIDGSPEPTLHGTGTEDLFNGGFYFDHGPFRHALHGMSRHVATPRGDSTTAYRLLLADAIPFRTRIRAELERGPTGELPMYSRTVAYYYSRF